LFVWSDFKVVEYEPETMSGIIRCTAELLDYVIVALTLIKDIQGKVAWFQTLGTSGTIKACREKYGYKPPKAQAKPRKERLSLKPSEIMKYSK